MHPLYTLTAFFSLSLLHLSHTLPTSSQLSKKQTQNQNPPFRGPDNLVGYSPSHDVPVKNTSVQYTLVKGQKEDADKGVYLDFSDVGQPQPLRGSLGGTDPGPSRFSFLFCDSGCVGVLEMMVNRNNRKRGISAYEQR